MPAKVLSISNMKGGVGKTTISVALAHELARGVGGAPPACVLLIDLDAQANASFWICGDQDLTALIEQGKTLEAFLEDAVVFEKAVSLKNYVFPQTSEPGDVSVIPSSPELRLIEREMIVFLSRRRRNLLEIERVVADILDAQMKELRARFDYILFDTAPGISALTEAALRSSEVVIVPTVPDFISNLGLEAFCKNVFWSNRGGGDQRKPWVVANMVKTTAYHRAMLDEMRLEAASEEGGFNMFKIEIPDMPWIEEAAVDAQGESRRKFENAESDVFTRLTIEVLQAAGARKAR
jgi:cellulose biosynthesis protein BcsQ